MDIDILYFVVYFRVQGPTQVQLHQRFVLQRLTPIKCWGICIDIGIIMSICLSVCPTFENVDIKSMCEFYVIKCILFDFGITSMVKKNHTTFAWKLISCGNFGKKICCKIHLGHNQLYLTGHVGYSPFRIVSSWLYCRTSITRILMFSLLTTITLKKDFFQLYPKKYTFF